MATSIQRAAGNRERERPFPTEQAVEIINSFDLEGRTLLEEKAGAIWGDEFCKAADAWSPAN